MVKSLKGEGGDGKKSGNGAKKKSSAGSGEKPTEEQVRSEITLVFLNILYHY